MTNVPKTWGPEEYLDINSINYLAAVKKRTNGDEQALAKALEGINHLGRDNARTPVQWSSAPNGGFSKTPTTKPWMRTNDNYTSINVEAQQNDPNSVLNFYRKVISVRKQRAGLLGHGQFRLLEEDDEELFKFVKIAESGEKALVVLNFTDKVQKYELPSEFSAAEVVLDTREDGEKGQLKAYEGRLYVAAK